MCRAWQCAAVIFRWDGDDELVYCYYFRRWTGSASRSLSREHLLCWRKDPTNYLLAYPCAMTRWHQGSTQGEYASNDGGVLFVFFVSWMKLPSLPVLWRSASRRLCSSQGAASSFGYLLSRRGREVAHACLYVVPSGSFLSRPRNCSTQPQLPISSLQ